MSTATTVRASGTSRAIFDRLPGLADLVPFVELADGLPTAVEQVADRLWVKRDDRTGEPYGGNKLRKLEFLLGLAVRRNGPVITAGATGSHHVLCTAHCTARLGLPLEVIQFPQPETDHVAAVRAALAEHDHVVVHPIDGTGRLPVALAAAAASLAPSRPTVVPLGASTPLGALGYVSAGLELTADGIAEPDEVVVACSTGGTAVGIGLGLRLGGWHSAEVRAVRVADATITNPVSLRLLEAGTMALLAAGGCWPRRGRWRLDSRWLGHGYGHPTDAGQDAARWAARHGLDVEDTYSAKALAAALARVERGGSVVFVQTYAGSAH